MHHFEIKAVYVIPFNHLDKMISFSYSRPAILLLLFLKSIRTIVSLEQLVTLIKTSGFTYDQIDPRLLSGLRFSLLYVIFGEFRVEFLNWVISLRLPFTCPYVTGHICLWGSWFSEVVRNEMSYLVLQESLLHRLWERKQHSERADGAKLGCAVIVATDR